MNKSIFKAIKAKEVVDRSQVGNQSCFRNERINKEKFKMSQTWKLPDQGIFEFDFVWMGPKPHEAEQSPMEDIQVLLEWFDMTYQQLKSKAKGKEALARVGEVLSECFRGISEYFVFSSE